MINKSCSFTLILCIAYTCSTHIKVWYKQEQSVTDIRISICPVGWTSRMFVRCKGIISLNVKRKADHEYLLFILLTSMKGSVENWEVFTTMCI